MTYWEKLRQEVQDLHGQVVAHHTIDWEKLQKYLDRIRQLYWLHACLD